MPASVKELYTYNPTRRSNCSRMPAIQRLQDQPDSFERFARGGLLLRHKRTVGKGGDRPHSRAERGWPDCPDSGRLAYKELSRSSTRPTPPGPNRPTTPTSTTGSTPAASTTRLSCGGQRRLPPRGHGFQRGHEDHEEPDEASPGPGLLHPHPRYPQSVMWWPWIRNYSGETTVGYFPGESWVKFV